MTLRPYQTAAIQSLFDYFYQNSEGMPVLAMPTGTGKSHVIAGFIQQTLSQWPSQRFLIATHVKEIIAHNAAKLLEAWPQAPLGIHSASLKQRDTMQLIIYGGIASMYKRTALFGHRDILIIDEAHCLSPNDNSMYQKFITQLKTINPHLRVIGLTATPYRLGSGMITDGGLFTDICYDLTSLDAFNNLVTEGYIAPLIPKQTKLQLDISNVGTSNGDFKQNELQHAVNKSAITEQALQEVIQYGEDRQSWLIFASGIDHCDEITNSLLSKGITAASIHFRCTNEQRDERINAFKTGAIQALVNNNILTVGFDHPPIDLVAVLRPTLSPGLWVQMLGRATRPSPATGKENAIVLDFSGNTMRLGPINDPVIPRKRKKGAGDVPAKICPQCDTINHIKTRYCVGCGEEFTFETKIETTAGTLPLIKKTDEQICEWYNVDYMTFDQHIKYGSPPMMRVAYHCGLNVFREYICFEHVGFAKTKARRWWREYAPFSGIPVTTSEALSKVQLLRKPVAIRVWTNKKYPEVLTYNFEKVETNAAR